MKKRKPLIRGVALLYRGHSDKKREFSDPYRVYPRHRANIAVRALWYHPASPGETPPDKPFKPFHSGTDPQGGTEEVATVGHFHDQARFSRERRGRSMTSLPLPKNGCWHGKMFQQKQRSG
ncbi:MAG: hypothetical protein LBB98_15155 [Treponema sp.]|nr:hypothetical protein [Treponema sp.]